MVFHRAIALLIVLASVARGAELIAPPPPGKRYQGIYFDEPATGRDPTEHDVTAADVARFDEALGANTAWVYFSNNWFESRQFPRATCQWIRDLAKVPFNQLPKNA